MISRKKTEEAKVTRKSGVNSDSTMVDITMDTFSLRATNFYSCMGSDIERSKNRRQKPNGGEKKKKHLLRCVREKLWKMVSNVVYGGC